jgi:plastocyanin
MSFFSSVVLALAVAVSSVAGFTAPDPTNFVVQVGQNGTLTFNPETIVAAAGDTVTYNFHPKVSFPFQKSLRIKVPT